jgi:hypothetical protein
MYAYIPKHLGDCVASLMRGEDDDGHDEEDDAAALHPTNGLQILAQAASGQSQIDRAVTNPSAAEDSMQVVSVPRPKRRRGCAVSPQVRE